MMSAPEIIATLGSEGKNPAAIAVELNSKGMVTRNRMPFTEEAVKGFMRMFGIGLTPQEEVDARAPVVGTVDQAIEHPPTVFPETAPVKGMEESAHEGEPEKPKRDCRWPIHTDFRPDNLEVRD